MMPEETNILIIEGNQESTINLTLLNLAVEKNKAVTALKELISNDPSAIVALLVPACSVDIDVVIEAVKAGARAYIKKPKPDELLKRHAHNSMIRSE